MSIDVTTLNARAVVILAGAVAIAACTAQAPDRSASAASGPAAAAAPAAPAPPPPPPPPVATTLLEVFPAAPERDLVVNNCASCHNAACAAIGQRPAARWDALLVAHRDRLSGVDLDKLFGYLKANFDDSKPEPKIAPALLAGGCTPF